MKRKEIMTALAALAFLSCGAEAEARIDPARMALGGVTVGSTEEYVLRTYGKPKEISRTMSASGKDFVRTYNYGDSFFVAVRETARTVQWLMTMDRHNNVATPDGIRVGSTLEEVIRAYGEPDLRQIDGDSDYFWYLGRGNDSARLVVRLSYGKVNAITCGGK